MKVRRQRRNYIGLTKDELQETTLLVLKPVLG